MAHVKNIDQFKDFLARHTVADLQKLCEMEELSQTGPKAELVQRFVEAGDEAEFTDFTAGRITDLSFAIIYTKAFLLGLPVTGTRSAIQERIRGHLDLPGPSSMGESTGDSTIPEAASLTSTEVDNEDYTYLKERGLNVEGDTGDWQARRRLFNDFQHRKDFEDLNMSFLFQLCDLYDIGAPGTRTEAIRVLNAAMGNYTKAYELKFGKNSKRPCCAKDSHGCTEFAANELCPKRGVPKKACSYECYQKWKAWREEQRELERKRNWAESDSDGTPKKVATGACKRPKIASGGQRDELLQTQTQALIALLKDHKDKPSASGASDKDGKALESQLLKTPPHLVTLAFAGDHEKFGLHVARAIDFAKATDDDLAIVSLHTRVEEMKEKTLELFNESHYRGEREFVALVLKCLSWAGSCEENKGVSGAKAARVKQTIDFNTAFEEMVKQTWTYATSFSDRERFYRTMIRRCVQASIGTVLSHTAIKAIEKSEKFKSDLESRWGGGSYKGDGGHSLVGNGDGPLRRLNYGAGGGSQYNRGGDDGNGGTHITRSGQGVQYQVTLGGGNGQQASGNQAAAADGRKGKGPKAKAPGPEADEKMVGAATVVSVHVAGSNMKGARVHTGKCPYEREGVACGEPHHLFECPKNFADTFPRKSMPGWTFQGQRMPHLWNGDAITEACLREWQNMQRQGWFQKFPFTKGKAALPFSFD